MTKPIQKREAEAPVFTPRQQAMLREVAEDHPSKLNVFRKAYSGFSLRAAITAKCLECTSCDVNAIRNCSSSSCPLLNVRPYQELRK